MVNMKVIKSELFHCMFFESVVAIIRASLIFSELGLADISVVYVRVMHIA